MSNNDLVLLRRSPQKLLLCLCSANILSHLSLHLFHLFLLFPFHFLLLTFYSFIYAFSSWLWTFCSASMLLYLSILWSVAFNGLSLYGTTRSIYARGNSLVCMWAIVPRTSIIIATFLILTSGHALHHISLAVEKTTQCSWILLLEYTSRLFACKVEEAKNDICTFLQNKDEKVMPDDGPSLIVCQDL